MTWVRLVDMYGYRHTTSLENMMTWYYINKYNNNAFSWEVCLTLQHLHWTNSQFHYHTFRTINKYKICYQAEARFSLWLFCMWSFLNPTIQGIFPLKILSLFIKVSHREESNPVERKVRAKYMPAWWSMQTVFSAAREILNIWTCMYV